MGLPSVTITFQSLASQPIERGNIGVLAVVLKDSSVASGAIEIDMTLNTDIPATLSAANQKYLQDAFVGTPSMVKAIVIPAGASDYSTALIYLETTLWNIGCIPGIASGDVANVSTWAKGMRDTKERKIMVLLPGSDADHEAVINFVVEDATTPTPIAGEVTVGADQYTASQYSARIAGLIAGLPLTVAPTYQVLPEVTDVPHLTKNQADTKVDAGKFFIYNDGAKCKIARGVTSLVTLTQVKGADWQKIKLVRIYDLVYTDIKSTIEDYYVGKVQNSYAGKLILIASINAYYETREQQGYLDPGKNVCQINLPAQKAYLQSIGYTMPDGTPVSLMADQQIKEANTGDHVFLISSLKALDAMEDFDMVINI